MSADVKAEPKKPYLSGVRGAGYRSPYEMWKDEQGLDTVRGWLVENLYTVELKDWPARGGRGLFINLEGNEGFNDCYVCEIPIGKSLAPWRHIYEETLLILQGRGATTVWYEEDKKQTFEWGEGSYFAIPPNAWHQHHNGSGNAPVRMVGITAAPRVINTFKDLDFVFNNPYRFHDRFNDDEGYFRAGVPEGPPSTHYKLVTNFVADLAAVTPRAVDPKGKGGRGAATTGCVFKMINGTMTSHSSEWPVGIHTNTHRHGPGIPIIVLRGHGYSLMWKDSDPRIRVNYGPGSLFAPPEMFWHMHCNTGPEPLFWIAAGWGSEKPKRGGGSYYYAAGDVHGEAEWQSPDVIQLGQEDPEIHREFEAELAKAGIGCNMGHIHPYCTQK